MTEMIFLPLSLISLLLIISSTQALSISGYGIKDLEGNDEITFQKEADWWNLTASVSSAKITQTTTTKKWLLGGQDILGPVGQSTNKKGSSRTFTGLPPHSFVGVTAVFWYFDGLWVDWGATTSIDYGARAFALGISQDTDFNVFDGGILEQYDLGRDHIKLGFQHTNSIIRLAFVDSNTGNSHDQSFGFRELHIHFSNYSGSNIAPCHISEDVNPLRYHQCECELNQAQDSSGNCVNCAANCDICFGPADIECLACSSGAYWDGTKCNTCDISCQTCTGPAANDCLTCKYGYYNYGNKTCKSTCEFPFVVKQVGIDSYCNRKCHSTQFYWSSNHTCLTSCELPLIRSFDENNIQVCMNPCNDLNEPHTLFASKFLYENGSCYDTCKVPLVAEFDSGVKFCRNPCPNPGSDFLFSNRSCLSSCPYPLISRSEPGTNYCWNPCPFASQFLYYNGSCLTTCPAPLISRSEFGVKYCSTPCNSVEDYIYDNRSCFSSCSSPLVSRIEPLVAKYCFNPCGSLTKFLYPNGSCLTECSFPLLSRMDFSAKYCFNPCPLSADYIFPNGTCQKKCPYPLIIHDEPGFKYCLPPCSGIQYLYDDQSCYNECDPPLIKIIEAGVKYCKTPCTDIEEYIYPDGTCNSVCEYPYKGLSDASYKICSMNMDEAQILQAQSLVRGIYIVNAINGIGGVLTGFISPADPTSMLMWSLLRMLEFTQYMNVNFPGQIEVIFSKQNENRERSIIGEENKSRVLSQNNYSSRLVRIGEASNFLKNYWPYFIVFAALISLLIIAIGLLQFLVNPPFVRFVSQIRWAVQWNVILMFFCGSYGDLVLYSILEFQTFFFGNFGPVMSFIVCLVMVLLAAFIPLKALYVVYDIRKAKIAQPVTGQNDAEKKWANQRIFFEIYKSEHMIQRIFLVIHLIRVAFFNILIGSVSNSPLTQVLLINLINITMVTYLLLKRLIKDKFCFIQHLTIESMLLIYNICLLIFVLMDLAKNQAEGIRAFFGGIMVVLLIIGPVASAILIILKLFLKLKTSGDGVNRGEGAIELASAASGFRAVRARGQLIVGDQEDNTFLENLEANQNDEGDESELMRINQNQNEDGLEGVSLNNIENVDEAFRDPLVDDIQPVEIF